MWANRGELAEWKVCPCPEARKSLNSNRSKITNDRNYLEPPHKKMKFVKMTLCEAKDGSDFAESILVNFSPIWPIPSTQKCFNLVSNMVGLGFIPKQKFI